MGVPRFKQVVTDDVPCKHTLCLPPGMHANISYTTLDLIQLYIYIYIYIYIYKLYIYIIIYTYIFMQEVFLICEATWD